MAVQICCSHILYIYTYAAYVVTYIYIYLSLKPCCWTKTLLSSHDYHVLMFIDSVPLARSSEDMRLVGQPECLTLQEQHRNNMSAVCLHKKCSEKDMFWFSYVLATPQTRTRMVAKKNLTYPLKFCRHDTVGFLRQF